MMDSPNRTLEYNNSNFKKAKSKYSDIDDQILTSALAYQYLSICYLQEMLSIDSILIENQWEIGLIGPGNSCLTQMLEFYLVDSEYAICIVAYMMHMVDFIKNIILVEGICTRQLHSVVLKIVLSLAI